MSVTEEKFSEKFEAAAKSPKNRGAYYQEEATEKGMKKGIEKGKKEEKTETVKNGLKEGLSVELLSRLTDLSVEEIEKIKREFF